jgi:predicted O-linked N-acetylglucosamine transferase (SPINDLY family)
MIAKSPEEFVAIACGLAAKQAWSTDARVALRERMIASSLMDEAGFVRDLEALYRRVWRDWCAAQRPIRSVSS